MVVIFPLPDSPAICGNGFDGVSPADQVASPQAARFESAAMLVIGNELLSGQTREGNSAVVAEALFARGCRLCEVAIVPDDHQTIVSALQRLRVGVDAVIVCGGIGPTHDDITMEAVAAALGVPLLTHDATLELMRAHYGAEALNAGRRRMARLPRGATPVVCPQSIAPGAAIDNLFVLVQPYKVVGIPIGSICNI